MGKIKLYSVVAIIVIQTLFICYLLAEKENCIQLSSTAAKLISGEVKQTAVQRASHKYDLSHLNQKSAIVWGPQQDDEALFIYSIVKVMRPKIVVEAGMSTGYSTVNLLSALDNDSRLFTYDILKNNPSSKAFKDTRFRFLLKSQTEFEHEDIDNLIIDLAILDSSHVFEDETEFWRKLVNYLSINAIVIIHDTGLHNKNFNKNKFYCTCDFPVFQKSAFIVIHYMNHLNDLY
jgi:predicted O-methyltransferase YrrM